MNVFIQKKQNIEGAGLSVSSGKKADTPTHGSICEKCEMFLEWHPSLLNSRVWSVPSGSQEEIRQGDGEVLRRAGETPEPVGPEERVAPARGSFVAVSSSWKPCRFSRFSRHLSCFACLPSPPSQADNQVDNVRQHFYEVSLEYVFKVQEVQERKMFDFVEPVRTLFICWSHWQSRVSLQAIFKYLIVLLFFMFNSCCMIYFRSSTFSCKLPASYKSTK